MPILKLSMQFIYSFAFFYSTSTTLFGNFANFEGSPLIVSGCGSKVKIQ
jgi:hypothetical protein